MTGSQDYPRHSGRAAGARRVVFALLPFGRRSKKIPKGCKAAVFAEPEMESVLVKGIYEGIHGLPRRAGSS